MSLKRKKYFIDKKFQTRMISKAVVIPLIIIISFTAVLIFFANQNKNLINNNNTITKSIIDNQESIINLFLSTPQLQKKNNPAIKRVNKGFKNNLSFQKKIFKNSTVIKNNNDNLINILIVLIIIQTVVIFALFIYFSHKISGPILVMRNYLLELREGKIPQFRSLRKNDELLEFYEEFKETIEHITKNK
ncbi:hypothetical protein ACFL20_02745 [Spirochaetota bacterium]